MFCRKCGVELPDGASFCGRCGAEQRKIGIKPSVGPSPKKLEGIEIAARVLAGIGLLSMFLPWLSVPIMRTLGQYASAFGVSSLGGDYTYSIPSLFPALNDLSRVLTKDQYSGIMVVYIFFATAWAIVFITIIVGLVKSLSEDREANILFGSGIALASLGICWALVLIFMNMYIGNATSSYANLRVSVFEVPGTLYLSVICGVVTAILARMEMNKVRDAG